jgi:hypothetical protein
MMVEREGLVATVASVPGPPPQLLTSAQERELDRAAKGIDAAEQRWAATVRRLGVSACARYLGVTPQALQSRLRRIERSGR